MKPPRFLLPVSHYVLKGLAQMIALNPGAFCYKDVIDSFDHVASPLEDIVAILASYSERNATDYVAHKRSEHYEHLTHYLTGMAETELDENPAATRGQKAARIENIAALYDVLKATESPALQEAAGMISASAIASAARFFWPDRSEPMAVRTFDHAESAKAYLAGLSDALREGGSMFVDEVPDLIACCPRFDTFSQTTTEEEVSRACFLVAKPLLSEPAHVMAGLELARRGLETSYEPDRHEAEEAILKALLLAPTSGEAQRAAAVIAKRVYEIAKHEGDPCLKRAETCLRSLTRGQGPAAAKHQL